MLNKVLWGVASLLIIMSGIYFSIYLKGIQFKILKKTNNKKDRNSGITPFQSLMMSMAAKVGVGSLAGIALAIKTGGPGVIFWIWLSSFISSPNAFVEAYLGSKYKKQINNEYIGGPQEYIHKGLKNKKLAITYAILITITYTICFGGIQANTIVRSIESIIKLPPIIIGIPLVLLIGYIIINNTENLFKIIASLVPFMSICYIIIGSIIIIKNYNFIPLFIQTIIKDAFSQKTLSTGVLSTFIIGMQRGIFSNEAGIGTGAIASAASSNDNYIKQGNLQVLGTYFISLIITTITAFIIMASPYKSIKINGLNGIEITLFALNYHFGYLGKYILIISIFLFAISTILAGYYYGKTNIEFIKNKRNIKDSYLYKIFIILIIFLGSIINSSFIWKFSDIFTALLAIINIYAIFILRKEIQLNKDI